MMPEPFILWKKALHDTFYTRAIGTKNNKILERDFADKEAVKDPMIECKKNDTLEFDEI